MSYNRLLTLLIFLVTVCMLSCKKKSNSNPFGNSLLATVTVSQQGAVLIYRIVYNPDNQVDSIIVTGASGSTSSGNYGYYVFNYSYYSYTITDQSGNNTIVSTDAYGNIIKVQGAADSLKMTYTGSELQTMDDYSYVPAGVTATSYNWKNNNLTSETGANTFTVDYNSSQPGQPGDAWRIGLFLQYGQSYIKTNNLPIDEMNNGTWLQKYYYTNDASGKITQLMVVGNNNGGSVNDTTAYSYTYYQ